MNDGVWQAYVQVFSFGGSEGVEFEKVFAAPSLNKNGPVVNIIRVCYAHT